MKPSLRASFPTNATAKVLINKVCSASVIADLDVAHLGGAKNHLGAVGVVDDKAAVIDPADDHRWLALGDQSVAGVARSLLAGSDDGDMGGEAFVVRRSPTEQERLVIAVRRDCGPEVVVPAGWVCVVEPHQESADHENHATTT